jgi:hypothetical protein
MLDYFEDMLNYFEDMLDYFGGLLDYFEVFQKETRGNPQTN